MVKPSLTVEARFWEINKIDKLRESTLNQTDVPLKNHRLDFLADFFSCTEDSGEAIRSF
jgi:hypothetical protein